MAQRAKSANQSEQSERFKQAARELGCDDNEDRFGEIVTKLAKAGPQHKRPKSTRNKAG